MVIKREGKVQKVQRCERTFMLTICKEKALLESGKIWEVQKCERAFMLTYIQERKWMTGIHYLKHLVWKLKMVVIMRGCKIQQVWHSESTSILTTCKKGNKMLGTALLPETSVHGGDYVQKV